MMETFDIFIGAGITIFSLALLIISLLSYHKYKNSKLFFISLVLLILFVRGVLLSLSLFNEQISEITSSSSIWLFDLLILVILYITSLKR
jgi:hypothetical protein